MVTVMAMVIVIVLVIVIVISDSDGDGDGDCVPCALFDMILSRVRFFLKAPCLLIVRELQLLCCAS